jgi:uncharacterized membrane protein
MMEYYNGGLIGFFGFMLMILLGAAVIFLLVWFVEKRIKRPVNYSSDKAALGILKVRYAKGEISRKEYSEMKSELLRE